MFSLINWTNNQCRVVQYAFDDAGFTTEQWGNSVVNIRATKDGKEFLMGPFDLDEMYGLTNSEPICIGTEDMDELVPLYADAIVPAPQSVAEVAAAFIAYVS